MCTFISGFQRPPRCSKKTTFPNLVQTLLSRRMIHSPQGKSPHLRASPGCWPLSPRFPGQVLPCSSWQALAAVQKRQKGGTQPAPLSAASSSYSQGQLPLTVSSQQAMRACLRFKDHIESNKCTSSCIVGLPGGGAVQCCRDLPIPLPAYLT